MTLLRAVALAVVVTTPAMALADPNLDRARAALEDLQFEEAYDALEESLSSGENDVEQTLEIYQLLGEVSAALAQEDDAADAFEVLLILNPEFQLRDGVSPKISEPFEEAQGRIEGALRFSCEITSKGPMTIQIIVESNPLGLAAGGFLVGGGDEAKEPLEEGRVSITLDEGESASQVGVTDSPGNSIAKLPVSQCKDNVEVILKDPTPPKPADDGGSVFGHWALWGSAAVVFGAAGSYFGLQAQSDVDELQVIYANSSEHEYSEAVKMEDSARRNALFANIGFAAAGGAAIVAGVLLLRTGGGKPAKDEAVVTPVATPDGVGVTFAMPF